MGQMMLGESLNVLPRLVILDIILNYIVYNIRHVLNN